MAGNPEYDAQTRALEEYVLALDYNNPANRANVNLIQFDWTRMSRGVKYRVARKITAATMRDRPSQLPCPSFVHWSLREVQGRAGGIPVGRPEILRLFAPRRSRFPRFLRNLNPRNENAERVRPEDVPLTDSYQDPRGEGVYTYGIKLHPFVAGTWQSREPDAVAGNGDPFPVGDPHPNHPVGLLGVEHMDWQTFTRFIVWQLNQTDKIVVIERDEEEDQVQRRLDHTFLESLQHLDYDEAVARRSEYVDETWEEEADAHSQRSSFGVGYWEGLERARRNRPSPTPRTRPFRFANPAVAKNLARGLAQYIIMILTRPETIEDSFVIGIPTELIRHRPDVSVPLKMHEIPDDVIVQCVNGIPDYLNNRYRVRRFTGAEIAEIQQRTANLVQAEVIRAQVDPLAYQLPQMKPRYRAWSVSRNPHWSFFNVKSTDYRNCREPEAVRPVDMYKWTALEISSPVFQVGDEAIGRAVYDSISVICDTLKEKTRVHHCALPTLDGTTSIFIGHTEGFTLLELKKLVTLWFVLEPRLRHLHRHHRNTVDGQWTCLPLRRGSRLGSMLGEPIRYPLNDPDHILPHSSSETRDFFTKQMNDHLSQMYRLTEGDEIYLRAVWQYTSISALSRAMETAGAPDGTALAIRCRGKGQRTSRLRDRKEVVGEANREEDLTPGEVDRHRGVIEFRQMGQNLDPDSIMAWTQICGQVVASCRETNEITFREILHMFFTGGGENAWSAWDILEVSEYVRDVFGRDDRDARRYYHPRTDGTVDYTWPWYGPQPRRRLERPSMNFY
ncbi:hypothetical protein F5Y03DRAFT_392938 [Xylaria venustula]|nr:hypothetical protein F5Y03DRAFT_392938 [Xylaria venustula]